MSIYNGREEGIRYDVSDVMMGADTSKIKAFFSRLRDYIPQGNIAVTSKGQTFAVQKTPVLKKRVVTAKKPASGIAVKQPGKGLSFKNPIVLYGSIGAVALGVYFITRKKRR